MSESERLEMAEFDLLAEATYTGEYATTERSRYSSEERRDRLYLGICHLLRTQSTCRRGKVGTLLVVDRRIIATGYNGSPAGTPHCFELGCDVDSNNHEAGCRRTIHAEANVIAYAARHGTRAEGSVLYSTHGPCLKCAQLIVSAGIELVVFQTPYRLPDGLELLDSVNVPTRQIVI